MPSPPSRCRHLAPMLPVFLLVALTGAGVTSQPSAFAADPTERLPVVHRISTEAAALSMEFDFPILDTKEIGIGGVSYRSVSIPGGKTVGEDGEPDFPHSVA